MDASIVALAFRLLHIYHTFSTSYGVLLSLTSLKPEDILMTANGYCDVALTRDAKYVHGLWVEVSVYQKPDITPRHNFYFQNIKIPSRASRHNSGGGHEYHQQPTFIYVTGDRRDGHYWSLIEIPAHLGIHMHSKKAQGRL